MSLPILGVTPTLPPYFDKNDQISPFEGHLPIFCWIFKIFPLNHIKFPNITPMEIVITFKARTALLKKFVENGHFHAFFPMKFSKNWQVCCIIYCIHNSRLLTKTARSLFSSISDKLKFVPFFLYLYNWATSRQNQQNGMCAQWRLRSAWWKLGSLGTHWAHSNESDQTGRTLRLIWVFAGRTCHFVGFVMRWLNYKFEILMFHSLRNSIYSNALANITRCLIG